MLELIIRQPERLKTWSADEEMRKSLTSGARLVNFVSLDSLNRLVNAVNQQQRAPQFVTLRWTRDYSFISFVLFRSRLYSNGYFGGYCWKKGLRLATEQPWVELREDGGLLAFHDSGAHRVIARDLLGDEETLTLYRGTTGPGEGEISRALSLLTDWPGSRVEVKQHWRRGVFARLSADYPSKARIDAADAITAKLDASETDGDRLKQRVGDWVYEQTYAKYGAHSISASPDLLTARRYVGDPSQVVTQVTFSRSEFLRLVDRDETYVGFETTAEVAFISRAAQTEYLRHLSVSP